LDLPLADDTARLIWDEATRLAADRAWMCEYRGDGTEEPLDQARQRILNELKLSPDARVRLECAQTLSAEDFGAPERYSYISLDAILQLFPPAQVLLIWNTRPADHWTGLRGELLETLLSRFGAAAWPGLAAMATLRPVQVLRASRWLEAAPLARVALRLLRRVKPARTAAWDYLNWHPEAAEHALLRQLFGTDEDAREDALHTLPRWLETRGREGLAAAAQTLAVQEHLQTLLVGDSLLRLPASMPKLPRWLKLTDLQRPRHAASGQELPDELLCHLLTFMALSRGALPYPGLTRVQNAFEPVSLGRFAWSVFAAWWAADAPSKDSWAFQGLRWLGDATTFHRLGAQAMRWAREGAKNRAVAAIDLLAEEGSDAALLHLSILAERGKSPMVCNKALASLNAAAEARELSLLQLADRLVPDFDLETEPLLDFGPRQFSLGLENAGSELKPFVSDRDGKRLKDLPKPGAQDDSALAEAASARWKELKRSLKIVSAAQAKRLELALVQQRRWSLDEFQTLFAAQPLLRPWVQALLWGSFDVNGALLQSFRVAEDGSWADATDALLTPDPGAAIGLVHPLQLDPAARSRWLQVWADYELLQPFEQLLRAAPTLSASALGAEPLLPWKGQDVSSGTLVGLLDQGWQRGNPQDGGWIHEWIKPLGGGVSAALALEPGLPVWRLTEVPRQTLGALHLVYTDSDTTPHWSALNPVARGELFRDLQRLTPSLKL